MPRQSKASNQTEPNIIPNVTENIQNPNEEFKQQSEQVFNSGNVIQETIKMISKGLIPNIPSEVTIRAILRKDKKKLLMTNPDDVLLALLQSSIVTPQNFNVYNLYPFESNYLLYRLRVLTYGNEHKYHEMCPHCRTDNEIEINLSEVPIVPVPDDFKPVFNITLPVSGKVLTCKLLNEGELISLRKKANELQEQTGNNSAFMDLLWETRIAAIDGNSKLAPIEKTQFLDNLIDYDNEFMMYQYDKEVGNYGLQTELTTTCDNCGRIFSSNIPSIYTFFRPTFEIN